MEALSPDIIELIGDLKNGIASGSWYAALAAAVMLGLRLFRVELIQSFLPVKLRWDSLNKWSRIGIVFGASAVAALFGSLAGGTALNVAISAGIIHAVSTVMHKTTQKLGEKRHTKVLAKDPLYEPSKFRKAASIALPLKPSAQGTSQEALAALASKKQAEPEKISRVASTS